MTQFDGISIIPDDWSRPDEIFSTDVSLAMCGGGGWSEPHYFKSKFPKWMKKAGYSINELEMAAFVLATKIWIEKIRNKNILAYCDNQCTVEVDFSSWHRIVDYIQESTYPGHGTNLQIFPLLR